MSVWDFFQRRCSLTVDPVEWEKGQAEFERVGLTDVIKYQALPTDPETEIKGVHQSFNATMRSVLQDFYDSDAQTLLNMEDDCIFRDHDHLLSAIAELPSDWDLLYLGANLITDLGPNAPPVRHSEHLFRVFSAWTSHCIGFSRRPIKFVLDNQPSFSVEMLDHWISSQLPNLNAYCIAPMIAYQRQHLSLIWNSEEDYTPIFERSDLLLK